MGGQRGVDSYQLSRLSVLVGWEGTGVFEEFHQGVLICRVKWSQVVASGVRAPRCRASGGVPSAFRAPQPLRPVVVGAMVRSEMSDGGSRWERWSGCRCCPALSHLGTEGIGMFEE